MVHVAILAGGNKGSYIRGKPKCFVRMPTGETILEEVLHACTKVKAIKDIVIVAPKKHLDTLDLKRFKKKIYTIDQGKNLQDTMLLAKNEIIKKNKLKGEKAKNLGLLYLFGDTPFRKHWSIEEFIRQIKPEIDLVISMVHEKKIMKYYKMFKKPMIPLHLREPGNYKETNMAYFNPDKLYGELAKRFYSHRHTGRLKNMLALRRIVKEVGGKDLMRVLQYGIVTRQWHKTFRRWTPERWHTPRRMYKKLNMPRLQKLAYDAIGVRMDVVESSFTDGYVDVDSFKDYNFVYKHFFDLNKHINADCMYALHKAKV